MIIFSPANFRNVRATKRVVVGNISCKTTDFRTRAGIAENRAEQGGSRTDISWPSKPSTVTGVEVQVDVGLLELGDGIRDKLLRKGYQTISGVIKR
jgi:hypothetical protein